MIELSVVVNIFSWSSYFLHEIYDSLNHGYNLGCREGDLLFNLVMLFILILTEFMNQSHCIVFSGDDITCELLEFLNVGAQIEKFV